MTKKPVNHWIANKETMRGVMKINFKCKKCKNTFDCEMGIIGVNESTMRPKFEKDIICPRCGKLTMDDVFLTEIGQTQMTQATLDF